MGIIKMWKQLVGQSNRVPHSDGNSSVKHSCHAASVVQPADNCGTVGVLLFDYDEMDCSYGQEAFDAIYSGMCSSLGRCVFHDGDDLGEIGIQLLSQAQDVEPAVQQNALDSPGKLSGLGLYLVGLWTDNPSSFRRVHGHLISTVIPGYLGHLLLRERRSLEQFKQQMRGYSLPASIALLDGKVVKGTSKYGIGINLDDHALMLAALRGDLQEVEKLIAMGAEVNYVDPMDRTETTLTYAIQGGHTGIVRLLREAGAR